MTEPRTWEVEIRVPEESELDAAGESVTIEVREDEDVLTVARSSGLWLPADCQQGWCLTCAAKHLAGEVDHSHAKRYYQEDEIAGFVLPCVARPRSDLVIEAEAYREMLQHRADHDRPPGNSKLG